MGEHHVYNSMNTGPKSRCSVELRNLTVEFISIMLRIHGEKNLYIHIHIYYGKVVGMGKDSDYLSSLS